MTAATANYLIEQRADGTVDLCENQGQQWVTILRDISRADAIAHGFNLDSPAVQKVFGRQDRAGRVIH